VITGAVYYVTWLEERGRCLGVSTAALKFQGEHPSGALVFAYADGFASVAIVRKNVMGWQLAEANR
jgi:hypothetical protein